MTNETRDRPTPIVNTFVIRRSPRSLGPTARQANRPTAQAPTRIASAINRIGPRWGRYCQPTGVPPGGGGWGSIASSSSQGAPWTSSQRETPLLGNSAVTRKKNPANPNSQASARTSRGPGEVTWGTRCGTADCSVNDLPLSLAGFRRAAAPPGRDGDARWYRT